VYQISSKSDDFSLRYGGFTIYNLEFSKFTYCHVTSISMPFCFPVQNFTEIGLSAVELLIKTIFLNGGRPPFLNFKNIHI